MAKRLNYQIGITADIRHFNMSIQQAFQQLDNLGRRISIVPSLQQASSLALELRSNLAKAFNQDTGRLDLTAFENNIKASGKSLNDYYNQLRLLGPQGTEAFLSVAQSVASAEMPLKRTNKLMNELWITMKNTARWQLTSSVLHGFVGQLETAYGYSKSLDASLNNIRIVTSKTADDMKQFAEYANNAAKALSTTTTKYTDASLIYYQQGLTDEEVKDRTETTINMAAVSQQDAQTTSEQLTAIWNNFYDGSKSLEYYADVMARLGAETASSSDEIATGIQKFASVAGTVGLSYEYAASALATLTSNTRESASVVGTALRTLFTRFQGLKFGETLEDGIDLNKYSKALANVGIQVLDVNGNLKDMDTLLEDTAARWDSLTQAQQMALAQTVAGVRQYTQFVGLMENWDDFQKNLKSAYESTGTLQEQAEIYAESWQAARDRVRAAAEDIYDSLINPELIMELDNVFTPILTGTATVIDAMGGMKGAITTLIMLMNQLYGDKIAQGMRNMANNFGVVSNNDQIRARYMRNEAALLAQNISDANSTNDPRLQTWARLVELQGRAAIEANRLNDYQREGLQIDLDHLQHLQDEIDMWHEISNVQQEAYKAAETNVTQLLVNEENQDWVTRTGGNIQKSLDNFINSSKTSSSEYASKGIAHELTEVVRVSSNADEAFGSMIERLIQFKRQSTVLTDVLQTLRKEQELVQRAAQNNETYTLNIDDDLMARLQQVDAFSYVSDSTALTTPNMINALEREMINLDARIGITRSALAGLAENQNENALRRYNAGIDQMVTSALDAEGAIENMNRTINAQESALDRSSERLNDHAYLTSDWAENIVKASSYVTQALFAFQSVQSMYNTLTSEEMSNQDRFITVLTNLNMLLPSLVMAYSRLNLGKTATIKLNGIEVATETKVISQKIASMLATRSLTTATEMDTLVVEANTIARNANLLVMGGAIVALAAIITAAVWAYQREAQAMQKTMKVAEALTDRYEEIKNAYEDLKTSLSDYNDARNGLDQLIKGTDEWKNAVFELNEQVLELLELYPSLSEYVTSDKGYLDISDEGQRELLKFKQQEAQALYQDQLLATSNANLAKRENLETEFIRDMDRTAFSGYQNRLTEEQIQSLIKAINDSNGSVLSNAKELEKATGLEKAWAKHIIANKEATLKLVQSNNSLIDSNKLLAQESGKKLLEETSYFNSRDSEQLATIIGEQLQKEYEIAYNKNSVIFDSIAQQKYAELMGYQHLSDLTGNKGKYLVNGRVEEIDDSIARAAISRNDAEKAVQSNVKNYAIAISELTRLAAAESKEIRKSLANIGLGITDFSNLTFEEIEVLRKKIKEFNWDSDKLQILGLNDEQVKEQIAENIANYENRYNKMRFQGARIGLELQRTGAKFDNEEQKLIIPKGSTLENGEAINNIFLLAMAKGELDKAFEAYKAGTFEEFAKGIRAITQSLDTYAEKYTKIHEVIDDMSIGDTISESEFNTLDDSVKGYFALMLDGTYKLTVSAEQLRKESEQILQNEAIQEISARSNKQKLYENLPNYSAEDLSVLSASTEGNSQKTLEQIRLIQALGDQSEANLIRLSDYESLIKEGADLKMADYATLSGWVEELIPAYNNLSETVAINKEEILEWQIRLGNSQESLEDLRKLLNTTEEFSIEAFNEAAYNLDAIEDIKNLDAEELDNFAEYLQDIADETDDLSDSLKDNDKAARIVAKTIMKMNDGIDTLAENFENWKDILTDSTAPAEEYAEAMEGTQAALADLLDVSQYYVSENFVKENLDLITQAATGSSSAIDELKSKLGDSIIAQIIIDNKLNDETKQELLSSYESLKEQLPDITVGTELEISNFINSLNEMASATGMTVDQVNALCDSMGFEATFASEPQKIQGYNTLTTTHRFVSKGEPVYDEQGNYLGTNATIKETQTQEQVPNDAIIQAFGMDIAPEGETTTPKIKTLVQKPTGSYNNYSSRNAGGSPAGGKKSGGGGSSKTKKQDLKESKIEPDRYHRINRVIQEQTELLEETGAQIDRTYGRDKLKLFTKQQQELNAQIENQNIKLEEAEDWLEKDKAALQKFLKEGGNNEALFDVDGNISNYDELQAKEMAYYEASLNAYNTYLEKYNAMTADEQEAVADEFETKGKEFEDAEKRWSKWQEYISQYEETLDIVDEQHQTILDQMRELADNKLQEIDYKLEIVLDAKSMKNAVQEFWKEFYGTQGDYLSQFKNVNKYSADIIATEAGMFDDYAKKWASLQEMLKDPHANYDAVTKKIQDLQGQIIESASAIVQWADTIEDIIPEAVSTAAERFAIFTDQLDHNASILETIKELYSLQGVTNKTSKGFATLQKNMGERLEAQTANAVLQRNWADQAEKRLAQAQAELDAYISAGGEENNEYDRLKKARDAYLAEFNEAQEAYLSLAKEAMETAQEMYLEQIERAVYEFGETISDGLGLDLLQDKYDHYIEAEQRYLDKVNEAYEVTSWYNKLQKDIDEVTNASTRERLKALQEEIDIRREGGKLSKYDLDILEAKYKVMQAQMALEEAQNAKNNLQLVRDRQGNWNYQYTADPGQIEEAEQDLINAQNEWYNIAKDQVTEVTGEIVGLWQECSDAIKEIYSDMTLTDEERADRAAEIYAYYTEKVRYLEEEKQIAIKDMTQAGNESLLTDAILMGDTITDLTGLTSEDIKNIVEESGGSIIDILSGNNEKIQNIVASNSSLIDLFENVYATDLDKMTDNTEIFEDELDKLLDQCEEDFEEYQDKVETVADETGTTLEDLAYTTDVVSDSTDELRERGEEAADALWLQVDAAADLSEELSDLADSYREVIDLMMQMAGEQADSVDQGFDPDTQYIKLMAQHLLSGGSIDSNTFKELLEQRNDKIDWLKEQGYGEDYWGSYGQDTIEHLKNLMENNRDKLEDLASYTDEEYLEMLRKLGVSGFDTGGYTGTFDNSKLAFLHEKELVLNQEDTKNILSAVNAVRTLDTDIFTVIEKALDSIATAGMGLMGERLGAFIDVKPMRDALQQEVRIEAVFPSVTDRNEIAEALNNLTNDASQYIRRRTE